MNNSPYLSRPVLSERERRVADALRSLLEYWPPTEPDDGWRFQRNRAKENARAILAEIEE